ncbi:hypothetical protein [Anaerostipes sp. MSJ-23]|uniref:hypothetical protein n=1 Tax=unclassified Anaerostipes TaxID=2635253 RepID=UPI001C0F55EF|nr:hypothetical protein [Anaerostipes sp. MSJ-23]MBU5458842.1 hypothetical protein [Anaerostipes sp. MSJ-23]
MSEIFVEEENTVYEVDSECLKEKEKQKKTEKREEKSKSYKSQGMQKKGNQNFFWIIILCLLCTK